MKGNIFAVLTGVLILLAGCSTSKESITGVDFAAALEERGYEVSDSATDDMTYYIAVKDDIELDFAVFGEESDAIVFFRQVQAGVEARKGNTSSNTSVNMGNYNTYTLTTGGAYYVVSRVDNTLLYAELPSDDKSEAQEIVKELGY